MRKLAIIFLILVVAASISYGKDNDYVLDNAALKLKKGIADTSASITVDQAARITPFFAAAAFHADSTATCSMFVQTRAAGRLLWTTVFSKGLAADSTWYSCTFNPDSMGINQVRIITKAAAIGDSVRMYSGWKIIYSK